ncbi:hypothetical protein TNCV_5022941 [Trichonephila clavipes]|nr:hypothetical protein TNCV_5022941 [Trichonephila clavipes]
MGGTLHCYCGDLNAAAGTDCCGTSDPSEASAPHPKASLHVLVAKEFDIFQRACLFNSTVVADGRMPNYATRQVKYTEYVSLDDAIAGLATPGRDCRYQIINLIWGDITPLIKHNAPPGSSGRPVGGGRRAAIHRPSISHTCSIGFKSGEGMLANPCG